MEFPLDKWRECKMMKKLARGYLMRLADFKCAMRKEVLLEREAKCFQEDIPKRGNKTKIGYNKLK